MRKKIEEFDRISLNCDKNSQQCIFESVQLRFQKTKFDYFWDDFQNKYFESFWVNQLFALQEPLINEISFPSTFNNLNYKNYSN